jgi:Spy/CpxP family protein refolding chaperone
MIRRRGISYKGAWRDAGIGRYGAWLWAAVLLCLLVGVVFSQAGPPPMRHQVRDRVNTIMIAKLDEYLDLTVEQADQFLPRFRHFNERREELQRERGDVMEELIRVEESDPEDEVRIEELLDRLEAIDGDMLELRRGFREEVRPILSPRQRARLEIFSHRFPEQLRRLIEDVRRDRMEVRERPRGPGKDMMGN